MHAYDPELTLSCCPWLPLEKLRNASILITGGTGLVGYNILRELSHISEALGLTIYALVRNEEKARLRFGDFSHKIKLIPGDVMEEPALADPIDYIIHGASITSSRTFVEQPVETVMTSVMGMRNLLELARKKQVKSMVYLSSMEVYGSDEDDRLLTENDVGYLNPLSIRSSYPESKRLCETLCVSYAKEYGVPVKIARLAQTFGPGMQAGDRRAIIQFIGSALNGENIEIKSSGESARMYLYTFDAVSALLTLLLKGQDGTAYNLANKDSYCSIRQLAEKIADIFRPEIRVLVNTGTEEERAIYPPDSFLRLDTSRLENLGWHALVSLEESLRALGTQL